MPPRKDVDAAASVPAFYGAELRWKRENAGLTLQELAEGCFYSVAFLSQIEMGDRRMPLDLARHADQLLGTDGFFERRCDDARTAKRGGHAEYFADVAEMERHALTVEEWSPALVPGLLQTEDYARAVVRATHPLEAASDVEAKVAARLSRADLFDAARPPELWVVLHELMLLQTIGSAATMAEQLEHVVRLAEDCRVVTQVVPVNAGAFPFMMGMSKFMTFTDAPPVMYTEGLHSGQLIDEPTLVKQYTRSYDLLRASALPPGASLAMIQTAAKGYRDEHQH
ncbi:helix-turn-helix transcriptional regulator [Streptomyces sp. WMMB 322]|uniref:helix-turn-helix domain-containing protein n=1 Tax=Streptomyces sp. WMMB 322 TaxID=1286821 RepID=UPI0006E1C286|nr:helix-turn-helix transcriptional regulator [Streptomyces sp. WMMB 322]SCK39167.1 Helix-turn-helix domain-containing protein [Streptomyces sp. WMMB 322]